MIYPIIEHALPETYLTDDPVYYLPNLSLTVEADPPLTEAFSMREIPPEPYVVVGKASHQDMFMTCRTEDNVLRWVTGKHIKMYGLAEAFENHGKPADEPQSPEVTSGV